MTWCFSQCFCRTWPGVVAEAIPQEFPDKNNLNKALSFLVERSDPQRARDLLRHYFNCLDVIVATKVRLIQPTQKIYKLAYPPMTSQP